MRLHMYISIESDMKLFASPIHSVSVFLVKTVSTSLCSNPVLHLVVERVILLEVHSTTSIPM